MAAERIGPGARTTACSSRQDCFREGRLFHGKPDQMALPATVGSGPKPGSPRAGGKPMRKAFVETLVDIAQSDERVVLLTGDLGFMVLEPFMKAFPGRFLNAGVAEQNMMGVATGLAESGYIPFVYSIVPFSVIRPLEFIRNGPIYHGLPVRIVGV